MEVRCCVSCGESFNVRPQTPNQTYCPLTGCQQLRKQRWKNFKLQNDPDYRENQNRAQANWLSRNPDYWKKYRAQNKKYAERNREMQRNRNHEFQRLGIAKSDASNTSSILPSGVYRVHLVEPDVIAKRGAWIVEITVLSAEATTPKVSKKIAKR